MLRKKIVEYVYTNVCMHYHIHVLPEMACGDIQSNFMR